MSADPAESEKEKWNGDSASLATKKTALGLGLNRQIERCYFCQAICSSLTAFVGALALARKKQRFAMLAVRKNYVSTIIPLYFGLGLGSSRFLAERRNSHKKWIFEFCGPLTLRTIAFFAKVRALLFPWLLSVMWVRKLSLPIQDPYNKKFC